MRGPVTPDVLRGAKMDALVQAGRPVAVWGADLQGAAVALTANALDQVLGSRRTGALVVPVGAEELFRAHAWRMAERGVVRRVFTCAAQAREWASAQVRLLSQQAAWEQRSRPCAIRLAAERGLSALA